MDSFFKSIPHVFVDFLPKSRHTCQRKLPPPPPPPTPPLPHSTPRGLEFRSSYAKHSWLSSPDPLTPQPCTAFQTSPTSRVHRHLHLHPDSPSVLFPSQSPQRNPVLSSACHLQWVLSSAPASLHILQPTSPLQFRCHLLGFPAALPPAMHPSSACLCFMTVSVVPAIQSL